MVLVAALVLGLLLPQLRADLEIRHEALARAIAGQVETYLLGARRELRALAEDLRNHQGGLPASHWFGHLDAHTGTGDVFAAIYITDSDDSVYSVGLPRAERRQRGDLLKLDLSKWAALREARERNEELWSETFLSAVTGRLAVTLAIPVAGQVLVGEIAIDRLSQFIGRSPAGSGLLTMILDRRGQIIAHSQAALGGQQLSLGHLPIVRDALEGRFATRAFEWDGERFVGTSVGVPQLGWIVLVAQPRIEAFRAFLSTLWVLAAGALVTLPLAILVAWALARGFARRIGRYADQAHAIAEGDYDQPWPISQIQEFDGLASDLDRMSLAIRQRERDLATSEARFRSVINNAPVVLFQFDEHGVFTFSEGRGLAGIGLAAGEVVGQSAFELYRDYPEVCDYARRALGGESVRFTTWIGNVFFDVYANPVRDIDGSLQVIGVTVDITERQRAEEALRQANLVVENSPAMLFRWKAEDGWPVVFVSHNVKQLGYSPEELLDGSFRFVSLVHPEDLERIGQEGLAYSERGMDHFQQEYRIVAKDGTVRWVDDRTVAERNSQGEITHYQGIVIDITERKKMEEALRLTQFSVDCASDSILWVDDEGKLVYANDAACASMGYSREELLSMKVFDIDPDFPAEEFEAHKVELRRRGAMKFESRHRTKDGRLFPVEVTTNYLEHNGRFLGCAFDRDITERKQAEEALRQSRNLLQTVLDTIPERVFWKDRDSRYLGCNRPFALDAGVDSPDEMVGRDDYQMGWREQADLYRNDDKRVLESGKSKLDYEEPQTTPDGRHIWLRTSKVPLRDADGVIFGILGTYQDITERKWTEEALLLTQFAMDHASDNILWVDGEGKLIYVNHAACASLGYAREELLRMKIFDIDPDFSLDGFENHKAELQRRGSMTFESRHRTKDGRLFPVEVTGNYLEYKGGFLACAFDRDISERKAAEEALRASEALLAKTTADAPAMIHQFLLRPDGTSCFPYASAWCWEIFGVPPEALRENAAPLLDRILPEDRPGFEESVALSARTLELWRHEYRLRSARGDIVWHQGISRPERLADGSILWSGIFFDTTDRKRADEELQRHREQLEDLVAERTAELRQAMTQLVQAEKLAALGHLVAGVAHELNTPLGNSRVVASSLGETLREFEAGIEAGGLPRSQLDAFLARGREAVAILERNTARAADLIGHFKQVAVDQTSARRRRFNLRQTVEELLATLQSQFKQTAHRIELDIPPDLELDSYPGPLEQVIGNLVTNSLTHGFMGMKAGTVRVRATPLGPDRVQIDYADDGAGIPEALHSRIFEPFFTTRLGQGGSGLGLYIVYNLVTGVLGGAIEADSSPGHGATFTLTLPRAAPDRPTVEPTRMISDVMN